MPLSLDQQHVGRRERRQPLGRRQVDRERAQVAVVDADQLGAGGDGAPQLVLVVHLDQGVEAARRPLAEQRGQLAVVAAPRR